MTNTCSDTFTCSKMPCGHPSPIKRMLNFDLSLMPKHLRKPIKLLFKQYAVLDIELCDDSLSCNTERHGKLMVRKDRYAIIRYANTNGDVFKWRINEDEFPTN